MQQQLKRRPFADNDLSWWRDRLSIITLIAMTISRILETFLIVAFVGLQLAGIIELPPESVILLAVYSLVRAPALVRLYWQVLRPDPDPP